ncbi:hypothetical protein LguiA_011103 [Lonicera macranthoides]
METTTPYLDGRVKPQIRHHPPTEDNNNNNNLFIDFLDEYSLFRRVLTLRELPVLSVLPIPGFPLLRSSSSGEEADDKKKKLNIKVERLLKVVDYQYLRSENDYYKAILDYDNVICICLGGKYDPFDHFVAPDDDTYHFVDLVAKKHKETRFLIADSVYCPELVRLLNPDTVLMSIQVIKERKSLGFLSFGDIKQCSGEDGAHDMGFAKLLSEFEVINATEAEKNYKPENFEDDYIYYEYDCDDCDDYDCLCHCSGTFIL